MNGLPKSSHVAIQGELGSNSHMAALAMFPSPITIASCALSAEVVERLAGGDVDFAVLPIENSLHGSVAEHYDLLLEHDVRITAESMLRIRHNLIVAPGVLLGEVRRVASHPVALSQCRRWLRAHPHLEVVPCYDTAGSVKDLMAAGLRDTAGIAPELAASQYRATVLIRDIEDHAENYTRFLKLERATATAASVLADKMSLAFSVEHRPGSLIAVLQHFQTAGMNLTRIESRPIPGRPWEYIFYVDVRFRDHSQADAALAHLGAQCLSVKELGRFIGG